VIVRINGRTMAQPRSLNTVLNEAYFVLARGGSYEVNKDDTWIKATEAMTYARIKFEDGSVLDPLDDSLNNKPTWRTDVV